LELENVEILRARIDEAPQVKFDFITARAFGNFSEILPWAHPRLSNPEFPNSSGAPGKIVLWLGSADSKSVQKSPSWSWQPEIPIPRSKNSLILPGTPI
ncbi:MAG: class I SAM-dependent methyltransferase, partial [Acidobacteria bacterium]|nr:class I SAM-dependent methyltransferase [Acidobacteriota bacterium]